MNTNENHELGAYEDKPLTPDLFDKLISHWGSKDLVVIYSFKKGEDVYVGRTVDLRARLKDHQKSPYIASKKKDCRKLYNTVVKYGWDQFVFKILEVISAEKPSGEKLSREELILISQKKEADYINKLRPSLNIISTRWETDGETPAKRADRSHLRGVPRTDEVKEKISKNLTGRQLPESTRRAISASNGSPVIANCITDGTEASYCSYRQLSEDLKIKYETIKKYVDSDKVYTSKLTKKQYKIISVKK